MPAPYPQEFREDVVAVARGRDAQTTLRQIAEDFGIGEATLSNWLTAAEVEAGRVSGPQNSPASPTTGGAISA